MTVRRALSVAILIAWFLAAAAAGTPPSVGDLTRRWIEATGGEKALRRLGSVTFRGDATEEGVAGTFVEVASREGFDRVTSQQGDTREETCTGTTAWLRDWNGHVRELEGRDGADARAESLIDALLFAGGALSLDEGRAKVTGDDETQAHWIVRVSVENATPFELFLDKATFLPSKIVRKPYDDTIVLEPSDWKTVAGVKVPFTVKRSGGERDTQDVTVVRAYTASRKGPKPPFARPKDGPSDVLFASGTSSLGIPFNFENDHIMMDGRVGGGAPIWFMLDTGADATIINKPRMAEFGLVPFGASSIEGGGNTTDFSFTKVAKLGFPGVSLNQQRDGVIDLSGLEKIYGHAMGGILGYDFLSRFVVRVDYEKSTVDLLDPAGFAYSGSGKKVPFIIESGHPHIPARITAGGRPPIAADMVVDCGAADTINLCSPFVKANNLLELARKTPAGAPNVLAGSEKEFFAQTSVRGRLDAFELGPFPLYGIPGNLMVAETGAYASASFSGTVGEGVLRRFNTIYDYARGVMILEPNAEYSKPFAGRKTFGATFLSEGPAYTIFRVTGVRKDSPADTAGLQKGDIVTAVDGTPAAQLTLAEVRRLLSTDGATRTLTVKRGDGVVMIECVITLVSLDE